MPSHCLIVLNTPLVAQDLALTLKDLTGSVAIQAETLAEAFGKLTAGTGPAVPPGGLRCAVLQTDAAGLLADPLCTHLRDLGTPVILLGHAAEMELGRGEGCAEWPVLPQPFGPAQVAEALQRAGALPLAPAGAQPSGTLAPPPAAP
ncbi:MAG: hypothetical protein ACXIUV_06385 [Alkalilacustris sp.]